MGLACGGPVAESRGSCSSKSRQSSSSFARPAPLSVAYLRTPARTPAAPSAKPDRTNSTIYTILLTERWVPIVFMSCVAAQEAAGVAARKCAPGAMHSHRSRCSCRWRSLAAGAVSRDGFLPRCARSGTAAARGRGHRVPGLAPWGPRAAATPGSTAPGVASAPGAACVSADTAVYEMC